VAVVVGSTRQGRVGGRIGRWIAAEAGAYRPPGTCPGAAPAEIHLVDLVDLEFPRRLPGRATSAMADLGARIADADAFVVVTPEYNRSYPASLKQALDSAYEEWHAKPVGFVSYGYLTRGLLAVEHLRQVFAELHAVTVRDVVAIDLAAPCGLRPPADAMLAQLTWWGLALRDARGRRPYAA
jgi:NAD(P)H-dependent FMN reductase